MLKEGCTGAGWPGWAKAAVERTKSEASAETSLGAAD
jgi:hypothetical protein